MTHQSLPSRAICIALVVEIILATTNVLQTCNCTSVSDSYDILRYSPHVLKLETHIVDPYTITRLFLILSLTQYCQHIVRTTRIDSKAVEVLIPCNSNRFILGWHTRLTDALILNTSPVIGTRPELRARVVEMIRYWCADI